ncbi:MAG: class I SAM-dependent methyltransferase [Alphaproteobacteria bacterium]
MSDLDLTQLPDQAEIQRLLAPDTANDEPGAAAWRTLERKLARNWKIARLRRALGVARRSRDVDYVQGRYENLWSQDDLRSDQDQKLSPILWGERRMMVRPRALKRLYLRLVLGLLRDRRPGTVLEVGCGNGRNLFALAAMYPDPRYTGIELSEAGVAAARGFQAEPTVGEAIARHAPAPLADPAAHRKITFMQGNAAALPFEDASFDVAVTILALEQMEAVRDQALAELARVASDLVVMIEPWRDLNQTGFRRDRIISHGYFSASVADLGRFGLEPVHVDLTLPSKLQMGVALVVAKRA